MCSLLNIAAPGRSDGIFNTQALASRTSRLVGDGVLFIAGSAGRVIGTVVRKAESVCLKPSTEPASAASVEALQESLASAGLTIQQLLERDVHLSASLNTASFQILQLQSQMSASQQQGLRHTQQLLEQRQRLGEVQASYQELSCTNGRLQTELGDVRSQHQELSETHRRTVAELQQLTGKHGILQGHFSSLQDQFTSLAAEVQLRQQSGGQQTLDQSASLSVPAPLPPCPPSQELIPAVKGVPAVCGQEVVMHYTTLPAKMDAFVRSQPSFQDPKSVGDAKLKPGGIFLSAGMTMDEMIAVVYTVPKQDVTVVLLTQAHCLADLQGFGRSPLGISTGAFQQHCERLELDPAHTLPLVMDHGCHQQMLDQSPPYLYLNHPPLPKETFTKFFLQCQRALWARWSDSKCKLVEPPTLRRPPGLPPPEAPPTGPLLNPSLKTATSSGVGNTAAAVAESEVADGAATAAAPRKAAAPVKVQEGDAEVQKLEAVVSQPSSVKWGDVAGLGSAKAALKEAVHYPIKHPHFFTNTKLKPWSGVLLYGPPGTGKTHLAQAVAGEAQATFFNVSSSSLVSKWQGESERLVKQLFAMAQERAPSIVFIDEVDALCCARGKSDNESARRVKTELLVQMSAAHNSKAQVLVLAATNCPHSLDDAFRRRFNQRIHIPLPDAEARGVMVGAHLEGVRHSLTPQDMQAFVDRTQGFSGSDLAAAAQDVLYQPFRLAQTARFFKRIGVEGKQQWEVCHQKEPGAEATSLDQLAEAGHQAQVQLPCLTTAMLWKSLKHARSSVGPDQLATYAKFTQQYGKDG